MDLRGSMADLGCLFSTVDIEMEPWQAHFCEKQIPIFSILFSVFYPY